MTSDHLQSQSPLASSSGLGSGSGRGDPSADFQVSVHIVNLERASLSRRLEDVRCLVARDDTASVNLYLDQRQELDYIPFRLTHGIRQLYLNSSTGMVKLQLSTQQRLDITPHPRDKCQALYDQLMHIKTRPSDVERFPPHQPKVGLVKPDAMTAYLTVNDTPSELQFGGVSTTPSKRRALAQRPAVILEQTHKKTRVQHVAYTPKSYRNSKETYDPIMSSSPVEPEDTPDRWRPPSSPMYREDEIMTPNRSSSHRQALDQLERASRVASLNSPPKLKPQFHSTVPTPRVLRSMCDKVRRYGREGEARKSKRLSLAEKPAGTRCIPAVLRALFGLSPVARDLREPYWLRLSGTQPGLYRSLVDSFTPYSANVNVEVGEDSVSENVIKSNNGRLGDGDDAREFLNDTINQVRREFHERNVGNACPLSRLFECIIDHTVVCMDCGNEMMHTEHFQDFCLELPVSDNNGSSQQTMSIGGLFPQLFETEQISYECEACQSESAMVHRSISKLPKVLVVYLKRFTVRPSNGYNKNRSRVAIDGTLEFAQYCSPSAFTSDSADSTLKHYFEDDWQQRHTNIPDDSPPSSSSLWFSSASSSGHNDPFRSSSSPPPDYDCIDAGLYDAAGLGSAANPLLLGSDDEELYNISANQSYSFYEPPSEDEQYQWAMEESIRVSQSLSQEIMDGDIKENRTNTSFLDELRASSEALEGAPPNYDADQKSNKEQDNRKRKSSELDADDEKYQDSSEKHGKHKDGGEDDDGDNADDDHDDDDDDEKIKAAIRASLLPTAEAPALSEKELQDQENRELEEAIRRSLMDSEENKENISPEKKRSGNKKGQKDIEKSKRPSLGALTRSCSQSLAPTLESFRDTSPPLLRRANTVDVIGRSHRLSQEYREPSSQSGSTIRGGGRSAEEFSTLPCTNSASTTTDPLRAGRTKGKDKAQKKIESLEQSMGLFRLHAMVSHTGLMSSTSEGHYVCDSLGGDGVWRSYDGSKRNRIGSISDLSQHRGRSGYLFFYVHCCEENSIAQP